MRSLLKQGAVLGVGLAVAAGISFSAARHHAPPATDASSHREAPAIARDPVADTTDFYMWVTPDAPDSVTFVMNTYPLQGPYGGPNFYQFGEDVLYNINIDHNGDAVADIVYEFTFRTEVRNQETFLYNTGPIMSLDDPNWNIRQFYNVDRVDASGRTRLAADLPAPPVNVGRASIPHYEALANTAIQHLPGGGRVFAGQRDDPFFVDLGATFDLLTIRPGAPGNMGGGVDSLANYNVNSIVLQVPKSAVVEKASPIIGAWVTTSRPAVTIAPGADPEWRQVSRLGQPLVNEAVIPLKLKDAFNSIDPTKDAVALDYVVDPILPKLLNGLYQLDVPPAPRNDLVTIFLQGIPNLNQPSGVTAAEMLRLNTGIAPNPSPHRMGVLGGDTAGFPNGRRPADDVVDIALQAMAGATPFTPEFNKAPNNQLGDGVDANERPFMDTFPYLAAPSPGSDYGGPARIGP